MSLFTEFDPIVIFSFRTHSFHQSTLYARLANLEMTSLKTAYTRPLLWYQIKDVSYEEYAKKHSDTLWIDRKVLALPQVFLNMFYLAAYTVQAIVYRIWFLFQIYNTSFLQTFGSALFRIYHYNAENKLFIISSLYAIVETIKDIYKGSQKLDLNFLLSLYYSSSYYPSITPILQDRFCIKASLNAIFAAGRIKGYLSLLFNDSFGTYLLEKTLFLQELFYQQEYHTEKSLQTQAWI